ncbi:MAG: hypothetical protein KatS3mg057_2776 [Herpetosiphonaceae bacterium]|nr:MAG: hypothetical protein KatS3mg057_2776 [Herpetosiphonaceae bacterium]
MSEICLLCTEIDPYLIAYEERFWQVVINRNQNYLGKTMLVLRRHEESLANLNDEEVLAMWRLLRRVHQALQNLFQPDHFNDVFLMNRNRHVHLHIIPRYANPRLFAATLFEDGRLGMHYQLDTERELPPAVYAALAEALEERLSS